MQEKLPKLDLHLLLSKSLKNLKYFKLSRLLLAEWHLSNITCRSNHEKVMVRCTIIYCIAQWQSTPMQRELAARLLETPPSSIAAMEREMTADPNVEVPEAAREFVKRTASAAKERAADTRVSVEQVTAAIENAAAGSVNETARIGRAIQNAVYEEVDALLDGIEHLAGAKSFGEAFHMQSDYFHGRVAATAGRGWAIVNYVSELVLEAARFANKKSSENAQANTQAL